MKIKKSFLSIALISILSFVGNSLCAQSQTQGFEVPKETLETYVGKYQMEENSILKIFLAGDTLKAQGPGQPPLHLVPITNTRFFLKKFGVDIEFGTDEDGKVDKLSFIRGDGQSLTAIKLEDEENE